MKITEGQLRKIIRSVLMVEAVGDFKTEYYDYDEQSDTFAAMERRAKEDPYAYKVNWDSIKFSDAGITEFKVDVPTKNGKPFNKSFSVKATATSVGKGVGKLLADMRAVYFSNYPNQVDAKGKAKEKLVSGKDESKAAKFKDFLASMVEVSGVAMGSKVKEPVKKSEPKGESEASKKEATYYLSGVGGAKLSVKPANFKGRIRNYVNLLSIPIDRLDPDQAAIAAAKTVDISELVEDAKALRGIKVDTSKYPDPPEGSGLNVLAINLTNTNLSDKTSAAWRNGRLEIDGPGFNNYYVTGLKEENGFIVPKTPIKLKDEKKQS